MAEKVRGVDEADRQSSRARAESLLFELGLVLAWSSGFVGARLAAETPSVFLVLFWRFVIVAVVLTPVAAVAMRRGLSLRAVGLQALLGLLAMFVYLALGVKSIALGVPAGTAALISAMQPLATAALASPVLGERVKVRQWLGLAVGFVGVSVAVDGSLGDAPVLAYIFSILATAALVVATLVAKAADSATPIITSLGIQSAVAAILFAPLAAVDGSLAPLANTGFIASVAWFVLFSTAGAYGLYWLCLRRSTATRVGSLIYLTPPVTMVWSRLMFGEPLREAAVAGMILCLLGVMLARARPADVSKDLREA